MARRNLQSSDFAAAGKSSGLPELYEYNDFRAFLGDFQQARQKVDPSFTRSAVCKRLGLPNSRSFFHNVLNGRPLTSNYIERFIEAFELDEDRAHYFRILVRFNQADSPDERRICFEQLIDANKTPKVLIDRHTFDFYREWYHNVVRTTLDIIEFRGNYAELSRMIFPPITARQARESLALLARLRLVEKNAEGVFKPTHKSLATDSYVKDELIKQYQAQCIEAAREAVFARRKLQNISTSLLSISEEGLREIEKQLQRFKQRVRTIVVHDTQPADRVYQLNIQLFPRTKTRD